MPSQVLPLDTGSISPEDLSIPALVRELNLQRRPNWILRSLMNALERKRQSKGLGWSRPWNKSGLNVFRTHTHRRDLDAEYFAPVEPLLARLLATAEAPYRDFAGELLKDRALMTFTFYHNRECAAVQHEGLTLSFGRKVAGDPTKRDRMDIVLEDVRSSGRVDGRVDRVRLYVCPWSKYQQGREHCLVEPVSLDHGLLLDAQALYESCVRFYHAWKADPARQWSHWSADYIDYFGPRSFIPVGSSFS